MRDPPSLRFQTPNIEGLDKGLGPISAPYSRTLAVNYGQPRITETGH
jgi:hypothetical protein